MSSVLVTGGTGLLGGAVAERLVSAGHAVRILTHGTVPRQPAGVQVIGGDLVSGAGLADAVAGATAIVHCASNPRAYRQVDVEGTRRLLSAARAAGVAHLIYISIVGVDRIPWAYYRAKLAVEGDIQRSGLPWTILRATQFHEFTAALVQRLTRLPVVPAPNGWRFQPVDVHDVAAQLATAADAGPAGRLPDLGGPEVLSVAQLARSYLRVAARRRPVVPVPVFGRFAAALRAGENLARGNRAVGRTWDEFLTERFAASAGRADTPAGRKAKRS